MKYIQPIFAIALLAQGSIGSASDDPIQQALESPNRLEVDLARDPNRHPDEVLAFFGIKPGMHVLDLFSGGGYYTTIVSDIVGDEGSVTAHNNQAYLVFANDELEQRAGKGEASNITRLNSEAGDLKLDEGKYDAALAILTWHDFYYVDPDIGWGKIDSGFMVETLCHALKPGAVLGIVDHVAEPGGDVWETAQTLHRIDPERIKSDLKGSCFEFEAEADFLRNPNDDYSINMYNEKVRGKTDRVVYRYRRK